MSDSSIVIHWGTPFVGREAPSLALFMEVTQFWEGKKAAGEVSAFRTYIASGGDVSNDGGFMVIEGPSASLDKLANSEEYRRHMVKAIHLLSGISSKRYDTGAAINQAVERVMTVRKELGIG